MIQEAMFLARSSDLIRKRETFKGELVTRFVAVVVLGDRISLVG